MRPVELVPEEERIAIDGTMVRREMARGDGWRDLVPESSRRLYHHPAARRALPPRVWA